MYIGRRKTLYLTLSQENMFLQHLFFNITSCQNMYLSNSFYPSKEWWWPTIRVSPYIILLRKSQRHRDTNHRFSFLWCISQLMSTPRWEQMKHTLNHSRVCQCIMPSEKTLKRNHSSSQRLVSTTQVDLQENNCQGMYCFKMILWRIN